MRRFSSKRSAHANHAANKTHSLKRGWNDIIVLFRRLSVKTTRRMFSTIMYVPRAPRTNKSFCLLIFCSALKLEHVSGKRTPPPSKLLLINRKEFGGNICAWVTHLLWKSRRIHRSGTRTGHRSSCRSRFCPPWSRTACPPGTLCTCCTGSTPHASACLCRKGPETQHKNGPR